MATADTSDLISLGGICSFEEDADPPYLPLLEHNPERSLDVCVQLKRIERAPVMLFSSLIATSMT
jgi:hypothetical protein